MSKKIGILTHYYNSSNYGGLLQSYALVKYLTDRCIEAQQVQYDSDKIKRNLLHSIIHTLHIFIINIRKNKKIKLRERACAKFRDSIKHTQKIYNFKNIKCCNDEFDAFITGSDQVWNPSVFNIGYSLGFSTKPKYSYAASVATNFIEDEMLEKYKHLLVDFKHISVRERQTINLLDFVSAKLVLDPVFLLSKTEWDDVASERIVNDRYIFSYFIGDSVNARNESKRIAIEKGWKVVNIPYLLGYKRQCDDNYADIEMTDITPNDFLSLIKNAECVTTDSFHAICFSYIFNRDFYVFKRENGFNMNSRISDILLTLNLSERYVEYIDTYYSIEYKEKNELYEELKEFSIDYLKNIIEEVKNE